MKLTVKRENDTLAATSRRQQPAPDRRYIYNGDMNTAPAGAPLRQNRRVLRRRVSTFNVVLVLFGLGTAIVVYVNNILTVNQLAIDVGKLQTRCDSVLNVNAALRAEVNRKSSWEHIGSVAAGQLGLRPPTEQPVWYDVDEDLVKRAEKE